MGVGIRRSVREAGYDGDSVSEAAFEAGYAAALRDMVSDEVYYGTCGGKGNLFDTVHAVSEDLASFDGVDYP